MGLNMRWNLDDLYTSFDSAEFTEDFEGLKQAIAAITEFAETAFRDHTGAAEKLENYITMENELERYHLLSDYCQMVISVDSMNEQAMKYDDMIETLLAQLAKPSVLFVQFVSGVDDLDGMILKSPMLREHAFILREIRQSAKYALSDKEELVISMMETTGSGAWGTMKEQLFATLTEPVEIDGTVRNLPMTAIRSLAYDPNPKTRENAYFAELRAYEKVDKAAAAALNGIKGEVLSVSQMRGYPSPLEMTLIQSRMEPKTLEAMLSAMRDSFSAFRKYFRKKAALLGHTNGLPFYDLFAPAGNVEMWFTYDEAAEFICRIFTGFSERLGAFARRAFESHWIDAEIREGKRGGAFCENLLSIGQSRIMANFSGTFNDVTTLAHELGHAYHGDCLKRETPLNSHYTMPIAETASTFCETLICDAALKTASEDEKLMILESDISGAAQVIVDIYSRFMFEHEVINRRANGPLSVAELNRLMVDAQKHAYGDGLDPDFPHPYMWLCKPHYYYADSNYYNFPYAFGQLFSKGLYVRYLREGPSFARKYDALLAAAGKNSLEDLAKLADIDITEKAFWADALRTYEDMIDDFCERC